MTEHQIADWSPDVKINDCGSIVTVFPCSAAGRAWIEWNVSSEPWQWMGGQLCVDHRMAGPLVEGMKDDGLVIV